MATFFKVYKLVLSPIFLGLGIRCRFTPTCSEYAKKMFEEKPIHKALCLTFLRLLKCNPWYQSKEIEENI